MLRTRCSPEVRNPTLPLDSSILYEYICPMYKTSRDRPITTTVAALSDQRLLQRIKELSAVEHHIEAVVSDHLREIERRRLYLSLGCSSMFDYAVRELGYSTGAAWRRLKVMRLCADVNGARGRLQEGTLTLDAAAQLQHAFERQERKANRAAVPDTEKQAGGRGAPADNRSLGARSAAAPGGPAVESEAPRMLDAAERESLVAQAAGKSSRQVQEMLAEVDPDLTAPTDRMRPLGAGRWELKAVINANCQRGLEQLKGLLSHVDPKMSVGQLLGRLVEEALDRHDPSRPPRGRSRTADVADETSAPKDAPGPNAGAAAQRPVLPAGAVTSAPAEAAGATASAAAPRATLPKTAVTPPAKVPADPDHRSAMAARRPAADVRSAAVPGATSAPKLGGGGLLQAAPAALRAHRLPTAAAAPPQPRVRSRAIPAAVRRQVWERDRGCCSYVDRGSGRRCGSRHLLEIDHIVPYAVGGSAEPDNLRLLCAAHHRYRHAQRAGASL